MIISKWGVLQVCAVNNSQQANYHHEKKKGQTGLDWNQEWDELKSACLFWGERHHSAPTSCNFSGAKQSLRSDLVLIERRITGEITSGPPSHKKHTQQLAVTLVSSTWWVSAHQQRSRYLLLVGHYRGHRWIPWASPWVAAGEGDRPALPPAWRALLAIMVLPEHQSVDSPQTNTDL